MRKIFLFVVLLLASCSNKVLDEPPLQYSMLPKYMPMDSICSKVEDDTGIIAGKYKDYEPIMMRAGKYVSPQKDTIDLPLGALVSAKWMALHPFYKSSWERYRKEIAVADRVMQSYYDGAKVGEIQYQQEILRLRRIAQRSWFEQNAVYLGFAAGLLVGVINNYVLVQIAK